MHSHAKKTSIKVGQQVDPICVWLSKDGKEETLYDKHFRVSISLSLYIAALSMVLGTTFVAWKNQLRQCGGLFLSELSFSNSTTSPKSMLTEWFNMVLLIYHYRFSKLYIS